MYLQYHASRENAHKEKNLIFCGLCLLYVLSVTLFSLDLIISLKVRENSLRPSFRLMINRQSAYHLVTAQVIIFACSDFLAQFILVRTFVYAYYSISLLKSSDIPVLDCVG